MVRSLYWFTNDLRLHDNPNLRRCLQESSDSVFVYCLYDFARAEPTTKSAPIGLYRKQFLLEAASELKSKLHGLGYHLHMLYAAPQSGISDLIVQHRIQRVYRSAQVGAYENQLWTYLQHLHPNVEFVTGVGSTMFDVEQVNPDKCRGSFSRFRKYHEPLPVKFPVQSEISEDMADNKDVSVEPQSRTFSGGESAALNHLNWYFNTHFPSSYKQTRNALDGWTNSSKFSAWLANGNLSPRTLYQAIVDYESRVEANDSTYWLKFELLWREFFHWHALEIGRSLFRFEGIVGKRQLTSYYPERLTRWQKGRTPFALVNAIMHQLVETGYISNRARQIAASALVNELQVDWRYGALFFQQHLIDFDIASNWGNWQYIAGVGCDPRGGRHFNLQKQTQLYDPDQQYVLSWQGLPTCALDHTDMVDWPVDEPS